MIKKTLGMWLVASALMFTGCGGQEEAAPNTAAAAPAAEAPAAPAAAPAAGSGGGGVCARAADCCVAYIEAMGATAGMTADQACAGVRQAGTAGPAAEPTCTTAINGWKQGLTAMSKPIPAACN